MATICSPIKLVSPGATQRASISFLLLTVFIYSFKCSLDNIFLSNWHLPLLFFTNKTGYHRDSYSSINPTWNEWKILKRQNWNPTCEYLTNFKIYDNTISLFFNNRCS
jgi:hypothetical protein